jgi:hypothetical protein
MRQIPPPVVSNSLKSVCQTRLRTVGGSWNTFAAQRGPGLAVGPEPARQQQPAPA